MKKKKILIVIIIGLIFGIIGFSTYFLLNKEDQTTTLNLLDKQWIESNKNQRFDFSIVTDIPLFSYEGEGIFLDFLDSLEEATGLEFNRISSKLGTKMTTEYGFHIVDEIGKKDILVYEDNYVLLSNKNVRYEQLGQIKNLVVGALNSEVSQIAYYLNGANVTFKTCDNVKGLFDAITNDPTNSIIPTVDAIVVPKTVYLNQILLYKDFDISYTISEFSKKYVLTLGKNDKLNNIITKYYDKWHSENYEELYNEYLLNLYLDVNEIDEKQKVQFRSKRYNYGFVNNEPFDMEENGINYLLLKDFMEFSNVEIAFKKFNSIEALIEAFNKNEIDFMFDNTSNEKYKIDIFNTTSIYDEQFIIIANKNNDIVINSINSLKNNKVNVIKNTKMANYLTSQAIEINEYKDISNIMEKSKNNDLIVIDYYTYKHYFDNYFKNYDVKYMFNLNDDYSFVVRDISENELFYSLLDYYLSVQNDKKIINSYYNSIVQIPKETFNYRIIIIVASIIGLLLIYIFVSKIISKKKNPHSNLTKEDKLRYIDMLTSLKNRNYLNENIEKWDNSEIYPQTIIIADLNNVTYINDNYGHNEGDNLIKEAANILIKNQISNSEIIRTNGNEFLIYLVGYEEKQIISYIRKLNKEFKELAHGFGVALGYSMINDAIKTIDDAINEATLEMRNNKEEANN